MKAVITVVGKDRVGIIAEVANLLSENNINILDISQTIMEDYFTMMMITSFSNSTKDFGAMRKVLTDYSKTAAVDISVQHEDIFNSMHKI
ncbi:ACT domain-containing protein [uncultured Clostridium sp.]|jgi:ACT domain-containing protein|uniref:ACT domain-containing protein n=1 Tax=uncultured Clostridium sp. TaxID=59620 RepID=UPI002607B9AF|nr:ACT domain-containing protein [uncultured Clostridium sp.]